MIYKSKNLYLQTRRIVSLQTNNKQSSHCVLPNMGLLWHFETNDNNSWNEIRTCCIEVPMKWKVIKLNTWWTFVKLWEQMKTHVVSKFPQKQRTSSNWHMVNISQKVGNKWQQIVPRSSFSKWTSSKLSHNETTFLKMWEEMNTRWLKNSSKCGQTVTTNFALVL